MMRTLRWSLGLGALFVLAALSAVGCGPPKRIVFHEDPLFRPDKKAEMGIIIVPPVDALDFAPVRDALIGDLKDPTAALAHLKDVLGPGMSTSAHRARKTKLVSLICADSSLCPVTSTWIHYELDELSVPHFTVDDPMVPSTLPNAPGNYIIVPQNLNFRRRVQGGEAGFFGPLFYNVPAYEALYLESAVAVVAPPTHTIVWTGVISSARYESRLGRTDVECEVNDWLFDLLRALGRAVYVPRRN